MSLAKMAEIIKRLISSTKIGKVNWEETEIGDVFQVSYPDYSIRLSMAPSPVDYGPDEFDVIITIYNKSGIIIERATDVELSDTLSDSYPTMKALYDDAKGYVLGTEQTLDNIICHLDSSQDIPF